MSDLLVIRVEAEDEVIQISGLSSQVMNMIKVCVPQHIKRRRVSVPSILILAKESTTLA